MQRGVGFLILLSLSLFIGVYPTSSVYAEVIVTGTSRATGSDIYGTVVLADGSSIPGALVTVEGNGQKFSTVTNEHGNYRFLHKPAGEYTVKYELEGFSTVTRKNVQIRRGRAMTLNTVMETTVVAEDIVVNHSAQTSSRRSGGGGAGATIDVDALEALPTARDPWAVMQTLPNVHVQGADSSVAPSGQKIDEIIDPLVNRSNRHQLTELKDDLKAAQGKDAKLAVIAEAKRKLTEAKTSMGAYADASFFANAEKALKDLEAYFNSDAYSSAQDQLPGTSRVNIRGNFGGIDTSLSYGLNAYGDDPLLGLTLRDVVVEKGVTAEYGRFTGGVVNVITKSGGNEFSGSVRINFDDDGSSFTNSGDTGYQASSRSVYWRGSTLGGPIIKDKIWFFSSFRTDSGQSNPLIVNNQTSRSRFSIEAGGQSTTLDPGTRTAFNPDPDYFSGFHSAPYGGAPAAPAAGQINGNFFYPRSGLNSNFGGFGGTTTINPDFIDRSLLDNWGVQSAGATGGGTSEALRGSLEYLFDTSWGDHALKFGFESGGGSREGGSSGTNSRSTFRLFQDSSEFGSEWEYQQLDGGSQYPGASYSDSRPAVTNSGRASINSGNSFYVNDRWQLNDKWSFNIGVRFDEEGSAGTNSTSSIPFGWENIAPRIGFAYDLSGDGKYRTDLTYAQYSGKYSESQFQTNPSMTGYNAWDGTFNFDTGSRGVIVPSGGGNYRSYFGGTDLGFYANDQFIFNRGPITTRSFFGHGNQGLGFFNNTVSVKFEYTGSCDELLTEGDLEEVIEEYKDYLFFEWGDDYPVGPGTCGAHLNLRTYQQEFAYLMRTDPEFRDFFDDWDLGFLPPRFGKIRLIERLIVLDPTVPSRDAGVLPDDAFYQSSGSAEKKVDDQWGLKRIGFKPAGRDGKGAIWPANGTPTIVAVVDSGIDLTHPELQGQLWANFNEIPNNGKDDDQNGLVDDVFGWNFAEFNGNVFDMYGHGTFIAGIIGAATDNGLGIAGINPWARIMPVKVSTYHGRSNNIRVAQGIYYAAEMGARVINVSFEGDVVSKVIQSAVDHAVAKGALVVVAAGNRGIDVAGVSPAVMTGALTVASIGPDGTYEKYSNHGAAVDIAAPGTHIISLRASRTDLMQFEDPDYEPGSNILGEEGILYHLSGTSFAAPHVAGVASLLFSMNPDLTAEQVKRMILQSARDVGTAGTDRLTGYGELDAAAALKADPDFYVDALIDGVEVAGAALRVNGTASADRLKSAWIELGEGENPDGFKTVGKKVKKSVVGGVLTDIDVNELRGSTTWTLQLVVEHKDGTRRLSRYQLNLG